MATYLTPSIIARQAYANLYATTVAAQLVWRDYEADFRGKQGDTITVRRPATFEAKEFDRQQGIELQDATETGITVTLDTLLDVSFAVTSEQLTLEIESFNEQLLAPAVEAIAQGIDARLLDLAADVSQTVALPAAGSDPALALVDAGAELNENSVPLPGRHVLWSPSGAARVMKDPLFHSAEKRGDTEGLREASIGRKFAFDNWMTQNAEGAGGLAFHETAFALVARTLELPRGAQNAAVFGGRGFGIRVVQDYDIDLKQDVISLDILLGVKTLDADRAVVIGDITNGTTP
jgi:hypothetical protein